MVRIPVVSVILLATATACGPHAAYGPAPVPAPSIELQRIHGFFTDLTYHGENAVLSFHLAQPSPVILLERDPEGSYSLLDSASAPQMLAAGHHSVSVKRYLGMGTAPQVQQDCTPTTITVPGGLAGQSVTLGSMSCRSVARAPIRLRCGQMPACDHLVIAIIPDRPVALDVLRRAARRMQDTVYYAGLEQIAEQFQDQRSVSDFERLALLAPDSTRWAVASIALR